MGAAQCRAREWLRAIALLTGSETPLGDDGPPVPRARVIMVATHADDEGGAYNPDYGHDSLDADLQAMIVASIAIDSATGRNVPELRDLIAEHAAGLPEMDEPFNIRWAAARDAALAEGAERPWITFDRFTEICTAHGVPERRDHLTLVGTFMHRLGRAVWYGPGAVAADDEGDALLADALVLDAAWLSRAFVQFLLDEPTRLAGGLLDHSRFPAIWTEHGRDEWHA